jgi:hypothetical protein
LLSGFNFSYWLLYYIGIHIAFSSIFFYCNLFNKILHQFNHLFLSFVFMIMECCFPSPRGEISVIVRIDAVDNMPEWMFFGSFAVKIVMFILCIILSAIITTQGSEVHRRSTVTFAEVMLAVASAGILISVVQCFWSLAMHERDKTIAELVRYRPDTTLESDISTRNKKQHGDDAEDEKQERATSNWWAEV